MVCPSFSPLRSIMRHPLFLSTRLNVFHISCTDTNTPPAAHIYHSLRFIPNGHDIALRPSNPNQRQKDKDASPYRVFYNIYKPMTAFKKSSPPPPDYQVVVVK